MDRKKPRGSGSKVTTEKAQWARILLIAESMHRQLQEIAVRIVDLDRRLARLVEKLEPFSAPRP